MFVLIEERVYFDTDYKVTKNFSEFNDWGSYEIILPKSRKLDNNYDFRIGNAILIGMQISHFECII